MVDDDRTRGYVLTRREALALLGGAGLTILSPGFALPPAVARPARHRDQPAKGLCVVRPVQTEGPYFVDELLERSDIRSDPFDQSVRPGTQLDLTFNVSKLEGSICSPLSNAVVDVWHCDADGIYSDVQDPRFDTRGRKFLRGYQLTDGAGVARFTTIYPGWYQGRTVHLHFKIRWAPLETSAVEFTSQLYFDDALTDQVFTAQPYASRGARTTRNAGEGIYSQGGDQLTLAPVVSGSGYAATFDVAVEIEVGIAPRSWGAIKTSYER